MFKNSLHLFIPTMIWASSHPVNTLCPGWGTTLSTHSSGLVREAVFFEKTPCQLLCSRSSLGICFAVFLCFPVPFSLILSCHCWTSGASHLLRWCKPPFMKHIYKYILFHKVLLYVWMSISCNFSDELYIYQCLI